MNITRLLQYICEESFQGRGDQIKEYAIATEALGRRPNFDPQTDTIVRVTVHSLRKRLLEVYQNEGAERPMRLFIPPGHYTPSFIRNIPPKRFIEHPPEALATTEPVQNDHPVDEQNPEPERSLAITPPAAQSSPVQFRRWLIICAVFIGAMTLGWRFWPRSGAAPRATTDAVASTTRVQPPVSQENIRTLMGTNRKPYIDRSGNVWTSGDYCQGGTNVVVPNQKIQGTEDGPIHLGGVRGIAHCIFPVPHGLYELRFHFAETSDLQAATRPATISINAGPATAVDVVDNAGGDGIATSTIVTGVTPENDGAIHVDFVSEVSLLNAVEILHAPSTKQMPVRILASTDGLTDSDKRVWSADRYFTGGRHGQPPESKNSANLGIYASNRVGRFRYNIPVVPLARYRVKLYFREPWFGEANGGNGGPGSRVFDVACNGLVLLKHFDILGEAGPKPLVKTFENVQATADGRIELSFMPVVNYPIVNAIEVLPEDK